MARATPRQLTEQLECQLLASRATLAMNSRGRARPEPKCPLRTDFQRDRDRIVHSKAFRRLAHKTQVFISPADHYRTRLTHTLEVAQIARTIARALRLNEDLTEAIALGHDLGHTPFGHGGEEALDAAYRRYDSRGRFLHYQQSLRIVEVLERDGRGLNLTHEVRDGIAAHSKGRANLGVSKLQKLEGGALPSSLEGQIMRIADRIAYINHDIDDAMRAGMLTLKDLPASCLKVLGKRHSQRITTMVADVIAQSQDADSICMSEVVLEATDGLKDYMYDHVYEQERGSRGEWPKVNLTIEGLFDRYMESPELLPRGAPLKDRRALARFVCDYIAGMTDRYATEQYVRLFTPLAWNR